MTVFRLWSAVSPVTTKPLPNSTSDWWSYCRHCGVVDGPHGTQDAAEATVHTCPTRPSGEVRRRAVRHPWTAHDDHIATTREVQAAARILGRTVAQIHWRRRRLRALGRLSPASPGHAWTGADDRIAATTTDTRAAAQQIGVTRSAVINRRSRLAAAGQTVIPLKPGPKKVT